MQEIVLSEKEEKKVRLAKNIKKYMVECNLTQSELAKKIGISQPTMCARFKEPGKFGYGEIIEIAEIMNVSVENLIET